GTSWVGGLLELDGRRVDPAPDLVAVLNELLHESGRVRVPFAIARNEASNGAVALLRLGFGDLATPGELDELRARFLESYRRNVRVRSRLFIDIEPLFREDGELRCGIVTNKPHASTEPLRAALGTAGRWATAPCGDR